MRTVNIIVACLLMLMLTSVGCKREDKAGKGGSAVLKVIPAHHDVTVNIENCIVYLKYDTQTPPSNNTDGYDENVACILENGKMTATFSNLKNGKYYIYGYGYDSSIAENVKGGIPYEITSQSTITINVPVSED